MSGFSPPSGRGAERSESGRGSYQPDAADTPPTNVLAGITWLLLLTVMFGGVSLLAMLTSGDQLTAFEEQFFRAGHGHAGVLTAVGLLYIYSLGRTGIGRRSQVTLWAVYLVGVLTHSGGFFVHMAIGEEGERSAGTYLTWSGGVVIAVAIVALAWRLLRNPQRLPAVRR
ncbi:MAG: hypothetical protein M3349_06380 [Actinomycetota bacterium]|nr:hypothetical protein [Actinomycetota bacterium]